MRERIENKPKNAYAELLNNFSANFSKPYSPLKVDLFSHKSFAILHGQTMGYVRSSIYVAEVHMVPKT